MFNPESIIGKQIDRFRLDEFIARGAMGTVYKAHDTTFNRTVALKVISKSTDLTPEAEEARKRLVQEARAAGRLTHPNIVAVHSYGETDEFDYICMEYVRGKTLAEVLTEKKVIEIEEAYPVFEQVLLALESASQEQIVHRDIKPSNIMIREDGRVKLMDFGVAKIPAVSITTAGTVLGTPHYMSPEQISGRKLDIRSDLFSVGIVLYEVLTGEKPFQGESTTAIAHKIVEVEPISLRVLNGLIPESVEAVCKRALSKEPAQRYQTPWKMLKELRSAVAGSTAWDQSRAESAQTARILAASEPKAKEEIDTKAEPTMPEPTTSLDAVSPAQPSQEGSQEIPPKEVPPEIVHKVSRGPRWMSALLLIMCGLFIALYFLAPGVSDHIKSFLGLSDAPPRSEGVSRPVDYQPAESADSLIAQAESLWASDPSAARQLIERATALDPNNAGPLLHFARLLVGNGDFSGAIEQYRNALLVNSQDPEAFCGLGLCYFKLGNFDLAVENYEACWALSPPNRTEVITYLGISYYKKNELGRARRLLEQALEANPGDELARSYLAIMSQSSSTGTSADSASQQSQGGAISSGSAGGSAPATESGSGATGAGEPGSPPSPETSGQSPSAGFPAPGSLPQQPPATASAASGRSEDIRVGMTSQQVREILGAPNKVEHEGRVIEWKYYTPKGKLEVKFRNDAVQSVRGP